MHIVAAALGLLFLAFRIYLHLRGPRDVAAALVDAVAALAAAHVELELMPSQDHWDRLKVNLARTLDVSGAEAEELMVVDRWLVAECGTVENAAVARLSRKLYRMAGPQGSEALHGLLAIILAAQVPSPNGAQVDAMQDAARLMKVG